MIELQHTASRAADFASELVFPELISEKHPTRNNNTTQTMEQLVYCRNPTSEFGNVLQNIK